MKQTLTSSCVCLCLQTVRASESSSRCSGTSSDANWLHSGNQQGGENKERDLKFRDVVSVVNPVGRDLLSFLCTAGHQLDGLLLLWWAWYVQKLKIFRLGTIIIMMIIFSTKMIGITPTTTRISTPPPLFKNNNNKDLPLQEPQQIPLFPLKKKHSK